MHQPRKATTMALVVSAAVLMSIASSQPSPAATAKAGQTCARVGARSGKLICTKIGKRLVYVAPPVATTTSTKAATSATTVAATTAPAITAATKAVTAIKATLGEWNIITPVTYKAGTVNFDISNIGEFPHDLVVAQGISYADLPKLPGGAVDEAKVKILGRTARLQPKDTAKFEVTLAPGGYVFYCSIIFGPTNHAERGQVLSVTVQ